MIAASKTKNGFTLKAYRGDAKTLLAFNFSTAKRAKKLAGFTIRCAPAKGVPYYIYNTLCYEKPGDHAQVATEPARSTVNAPIHKFRWLHVPGSFHQGLDPSFGTYTYTVTPRYFNTAGSMQPLDPALSVALTVEVAPFKDGAVEVGFTRGFTQSQAFVNHFGLKAPIRPKGKELLFDTTQVAGTNGEGVQFTFDDEYRWLGWTARTKIFAMLDEVIADASLRLDVFAYDLNEPGIIERLLKLAKAGRVRVILDNAALHHDSTTKTPPKPEDAFEREFTNVAKSGAEILRGKFGRYAHDKILIVRGKAGALRVLTGSTNFSVTGLYVNSNHVLVFRDRAIAKKYAEVFQAVWDGNVARAAFANSSLAAETFTRNASGSPRVDITFSPHSEVVAEAILGKITERVAAEQSSKRGSILFAVMELDKGSGTILEALRSVHESEAIFAYGISDSTNGISLYDQGSTKGVLVTGKPTRTRLPPPFNQVPNLGLGHQVHHKFIVCGFNTPNAYVVCGSSNLAQKGEEVNGDNLIVIRDRDVATVFAIEALGLVDHFEFLDRHAEKAGTKKKLKTTEPPAVKSQAAVSAGWFLSTSDRWTKPYFDPKDLHCVDRELFG